MRAIDITEPGGPDVLAEVDLPDPRPGPGEVLVEVAAAGVNRADLLQRQGVYPPPPGAPRTLGLECAGVVREVGPDVTDWRVGDRVAALLDGGGYAELVVVPEGQLLAVPGSLDLVAAASLPEALCTAWSNLMMVGGLRSGENVLVQGGSGGVGTAAIQLAHAFGARVLTTAGGEERVTRCVELGAHVGIDHRSEDVAAAVRAGTDGHGADVILDVLGAGGLAANLRSLATGGRLVVIGLQQGLTAELDLGLLLRKRASVHGTTLRARPRAEKASIVAEVAASAWPLVGVGGRGDPTGDDGVGGAARIRPVVHDVLPLAEAARAHSLLAAGEVFGKLVLVP